MMPAEQFPTNFGMGLSSYANNIPSPIMSSPAMRMPPLFSNLSTPQISPPTPFPNYNLAQARYARGGSVKGYRKGGKIGKFFKKALPFIGGLIGNAVAGPVGGTVGGTIGGALGGEKGKRGKGALTGALKGAGTSFLAPQLGSALGLAPEGLSGKFLGMQHPGMMDQLGGMFGNKKSNMSGLSNIFGGNGEGGGASDLMGNTSLLDKILLGTAAGGMLLGKKKQEPMLSTNELLSRYLPTPPAGEMPRNYRQAPMTLNPYDYQNATGMGAELPYFQNSNPGIEYYAEGGHLDGHTDGREDRIPAMLSDGEYVIKAPVVAALGNGNNNAGARKLDQLQKSVMKRTYRTKKQLPPKSKGLSTYMRGAA